MYSNKQMHVLSLFNIGSISSAIMFDSALKFLEYALIITTKWDNFF